MWQKLHRASKIYGLEADTTSFVTLDGSMEVMLVEITNKTDEAMEIVRSGQSQSMAEVLTISGITDM